MRYFRGVKNWRRLRWLLLIAGVIIIGAGVGYFVKFRLLVPMEYTVSPGESIQNVLFRMPRGSICNVKPGVYPEALTIPKSGLTIRKSGQGEAVIDAGGADNAVLINNVSDTTLEGLVIQNSSGSLILIQGPDAVRNTVRNCTLLEWGLDGKSPYAGAVDSSSGAAYTTVDLCYLDRGNHEAVWTQNPEGISFHYSGGHHTITNNIIWGVCRDDHGNPVKLQEDFGDGYPLYQFNLFDGISGLDGKERLDYDGTVIKGNHLYGAHDDMIAVQGRDENLIVSDNYLDSMGGAVSIVLRGASVGPVYITNNILLNSGMDAFKYASWPQGNGLAPKYISGNTYYSKLSRNYTETEEEWYIFILDSSYSRFIDGEVNENEYDNLHVDSNRVLCRRYFLTLMPGSGTNNIFTNNYFSTDDSRSSVKWFSHITAISFTGFNSLTGGNNVWEVIPRPEEPALPAAGAW